MVFTDPPYNVPIAGHASGLGAIHHRPFPMAAGEMDRAEFTAFLRQTCCNLAAFSTAGSLHYVCMDWRHLAELLAIGQEAYGELKNMCVWGQGQCWHGLAVSQPARARPGLQAARRAAPQQILLGMLRDIGGESDSHPSDPTFTEADQQIIARIKARLGGAEE